MNKYIFKFVRVFVLIFYSCVCAAESVPEGALPEGVPEGGDRSFQPRLPSASDGSGRAVSQDGLLPSGASTVAAVVPSAELADVAGVAAPLEAEISQSYPAGRMVVAESNSPAVLEAGMTALAVSEIKPSAPEIMPSPQMMVLPAVSPGATNYRDVKSSSDARPAERSWSSMSLFEQAQFYYEQGKYPLAERAYIQLLEYSEQDSEVMESLGQLSEIYYSGGEYTKAIDMLEQCLLKFPAQAASPERLFRLGEFYRDAELPTRAAELFFRVINSIVVGGDQNLQRYLRLARLAKFEIARSHYLNRDYGLALALFDRIELLDLSREDYETVFYYKVLATIKAAQPVAGVQLIDKFLVAFAASEFVPELLYMKADVLMKAGEMDAGIAIFMRLLESSVEETSASALSRIFWHQQAGNRLANRFYAEGDYVVALRIYQGMVELSELASWRMPVVYQIALCFEKLKMPERAKQSYLYISQNLEKIDASALTPALRQLGENVSWRLKVIDWRNETEQQAAQLVNVGANT
jgi:tetratricopeptide (TPR) repeat protein